MYTDDASLVRRCLQDDPEAIRVLVDRFQAEVFGLCVHLLHHRHDAEDVTQEVFLRIFRSLRRWDPTRALRPWILSIAVNRCRTWMLQRSRQPDLVAYLQDTVAGREPDDCAELIAEVRAAVADLRFEYRTVFVLFHEQGRPYEDIAVVLKRPIGTVKSWLHRARLQILERLHQRGLIDKPDLPGETVPPHGKEP